MRGNRRITKIFLVIAALALSGGCSASRGDDTATDVPIVGGPCEGCEGVFDGMPADIPSSARIAPVGEPGEPMRIEGQVVHEDGSPAPGTIVYAYHTNAGGIYPRDESRRGRPGYRHGKLRGWARADAEGRYRFDTIRPGGYPDSAMAQHVHMHVVEPGRCTYYIDSIVFEDDPRLTPAKRVQYERGRGGSGVTMPHRNADGVWIVERNITLGKKIPGYAACSGARDSAEPRVR